MIESIEIKNLRGIREGKLEGLTWLTILVGPNGCGKSTLLDALFLVGSSKHDTVSNARVNDGALETVRNRHRRLHEWERWLYWRGGGPGQCTIRADSENGFRNNVTVQGKPVRVGAMMERLRPPGAGLTRAFQGPEPPWVSEVRLIEARSQIPNTEPLHKLYTDAVQQGHRDELNTLLVDLIPGASHVEILTEGDAPVLHVVYSDRSVPVEFAGDGIHALLRLAMEIVCPARSLVLIEEPETHQHPGAMRQSARAILAAVRRDTQVVMSTHSLEFIDMVLAEATEGDLERLSVVRLQLRDGNLTSSRLAGKEVAFARKQIQDDLR